MKIRRVRTGCLTCRKRSVKCDQKKPICDRCLAANFHCEGYEAPRRLVQPLPKPRSSPRRNAPSPSEAMVSELPWRQANWRQEQLPVYHHFVTSTVVRLFRVDHVRFWRDQVAQIAPTFEDVAKEKLTSTSVQFGVEAVYEALLAVGAAHRASLLSCSNINAQEATRMKVLAMSAYGKALPLLAGSIHQGVNADPWAVLIVLLLCTYFECFMENAKGALRHLWAAIQLFRRLESKTSAADLANVIPLREVILRVDFLVQSLLPYATSSFSRCSDLAFMEVPFWSRQPNKFSASVHFDYITTERHRLIELVCGHNKLSRVLWGWCCPTRERPSRAELVGFYSELLLWKETSPATFTSFPYSDSVHASSIADLGTLPIPPKALQVTSSEAAVNIMMFNRYLAYALAMISTTDKDFIPLQIEVFNLVYQNLCISAALIDRDSAQAPNNYKACDTLDMGLSTLLYHGARLCFSLGWQKWTIAALHAIRREGLSNAHALANTLEIMCKITTTSTDDSSIEESIAPEKLPLGSIYDRLFPLSMPREEDDQYLAYFLQYGATQACIGKSIVHVVGRATWKQNDLGAMQSLKIDFYDSNDANPRRLADKSATEKVLRSLHNSVEQGWHGFLI